MELFGETLSIGSGIFLLFALGLALSFEFVNGFHDTANAVATVIYTHSLKPTVAVVWSGCWNLIGVLDLERRGRVRRAGAAAGGAGAERRLRRRIRHGFRAADFGDHLEPGHLVSRPAGLQFACADRLDHGRGPGELDAARQATFRRRRELGQGNGSGNVAAGLADRRLRLRGAAPAADEAADQEQGSVQGAREGQGAAAVDSRSAGADLHRRQLRRTARTTDRRAWD